MIFYWLLYVKGFSAQAYLHAVHLKNASVSFLCIISHADMGAPLGPGGGGGGCMFVVSCWASTAWRSYGLLAVEGCREWC